MYINEVLDPYKKGRRQFPLEVDSRSSRQKENITSVGQMIGVLLAADRRIVIHEDDNKTLV